MELAEEITRLRKEINRELGLFLDGKLAEAERNDMPEEYGALVENVRDFMLRGGKRLRPILFYYGYALAGGDKNKQVIAASLLTELLHVYLLIHDDIIDQDDRRHGGPSVHAKYAQDYATQFPRRDLKHFGVAMAINAGDIVSAWSYEVLSQTDFEESDKWRAISKMAQIVEETLMGQMLDALLEMGEGFEEKRIFKVQDYKTARYTVRGPLQLGAILAGAPEEELAFISGWALPLGIAFQVQDDILGVFGEEEATGKPVGADIREGKKTLLVSYALQHASSRDRQLLRSFLGKADLDEVEVVKAREIIENSGSLAFSRRRIDELERQFLEKLRGAPGEWSEKYAPLEEFSVHLLKRNN